jgi:dihydrodipicolinate synthase/N-acetylneuraminate lyase
VVELVQLLKAFGPVAAGKAIMSLHGIECGPPRPPRAPLSPEARSQLLAAVERTGVTRPLVA